MQEQPLNNLEKLKENALNKLESIVPAPVQKRTYSFAELHEQKDVEQKFIIPDFLPKNAVTVFIGEDGIGKTQITTQLCLHIAFKLDTFMGMRLKSEHGRALIVATEDSKQKFTSAIMKQAYTIDPQLKPKEVHIDFTEGSDFDDFNAMKEEIEMLCKKGFYDLIVIDAFSDLFTLIDGEINSNSHARKLLSFFQHICNQFQTTIIIIHHAAKGKMVAKRLAGKLFVEKTDSQGAGAITQKARTVWALSNDPKSVSEDGLSYTNYLHVVKANLMGKQYVKNAIIAKFNGRTLLHSSQGTVDVELYTPDMPAEVPDSEVNARRKASPQEVPLSQHKEILKNCFAGGDQLTRGDLIEKMKVHYGIGQTKIEGAGGYLPYIIKERLVIRNAYGYRFNPHAVDDGWKAMPLIDDDAPF